VPTPQRTITECSRCAPEELSRDRQRSRRLSGAGRSIEEQVRQLRARQASQKCLWPESITVAE